MFEDGGGGAALEGRGKQIRCFGNRIHDNGGSKLYHGIYFDDNDGTGTDDVEIAYNEVFNQSGGRGIQIYNAGTSGISNVSIHNNVVHDIALDGILFGDSTTTGCAAWNNIVYRTGVTALQQPPNVTDVGSGGSCIRLNNPGLEARVYNNTLFDCDEDRLSGEGGILFETASKVSVANNIVAVLSGESYFALGSVTASQITASNNLWFGAGNAPSWDTSPVAGDPLFVDSGGANFYLQASSPAIDHGTASVSPPLCRSTSSATLGRRAARSTSAPTSTARRGLAPLPRRRVPAATLERTAAPRWTRAGHRRTARPAVAAVAAAAVAAAAPRAGKAARPAGAGCSRSRRGGSCDASVLVSE